MRNDSTDIYRILHVLEKYGAKLVSLIQGTSNDTHSEIILRIQEVEDKDKLRAALEVALSDSEAA